MFWRFGIQNFFLISFHLRKRCTTRAVTFFGDPWPLQGPTTTCRCLGSLERADWQWSSSSGLGTTQDCWCSPGLLMIWDLWSLDWVRVKSTSRSHNQGTRDSASLQVTLTSDHWSILSSSSCSPIKCNKSKGFWIVCETFWRPHAALHPGWFVSVYSCRLHAL